jgi:hypothetical protein
MFAVVGIGSTPHPLHQLIRKSFKMTNRGERKLLIAVVLA